MLVNELKLAYNKKGLNIKQELEANIKFKRTFSLTLNA
jgi:hypothetical protein